MAAAQINFNSSSPNLASDSFPPLPSRTPPPPSPSDPPPSDANLSTANPSLVNFGAVSSDRRQANQQSQPTQIPSSSSNPSTKCDYASLFNSLPRNAGVYEPIHFDIPRDAPPKSLPDLVRKTGMDYWSSYLVGFFLDGTLNYLAVTNFLKKYWRLKGDVDIKFDGRFYYFKFFNDDEKDRILNADPIFIRGRMFILTKWDPMIGNVQSQIRKVPVWIHLYRIPTILWTLIGINWLVCHVGKLICFDSSTERMNRFRYAKALVEVSPECVLPDSIPISALGENCPPVKLSYDWKPLICTLCKEFGHETSSCELHNNKKVAKDVQINTSKQHQVNDHNGNNIKKTQEISFQNNWKTVNNRKKKYWRMKTMSNSMVNVSRDVEIGNGSSNPFENLADAYVEHVGEEEQAVVDEGTVNNEINTNAKVQANSQQVDYNIGGNAEAATSFVALISTMQEAAAQNIEQINQVEGEEDLLGNLFDENSVNVDKSPKGNSSMSNTSATCGTTGLNPVSSKSSPITAKSAPVASSSPYGHLKPPSNFQLPPSNVTGAGLTFPIANNALLSTAVPTSSLHSSKNKKLKGKFWADDDLDDGNDYGPEDVMPVSSKLKTTRRHTRNNPMYDPSLT